MLGTANCLKAMAMARDVSLSLQRVLEIQLPKYTISTNVELRTKGATPRSGFLPDQSQLALELHSLAVFQTWLESIDRVSGNEILTCAPVLYLSLASCDLSNQRREIIPCLVIDAK